MKSPVAIFFCFGLIFTTHAQIGGVINKYTEVLGYDACNNALVVNNAGEFNIGDTVLIMQMKGAVIDSSNTAAFGTVTDYRNAGNYEFNYISQKNGNSLHLKNILTRTYDIPAGKVQLVRVPWYQSVTITSTLTAAPWDGSKGGILALNVQNDIVMQADIDVGGKGFRGGVGVNINMLVTNCFNNDYFYPKNSIVAAQKGESIYQVSDNRLSGKGALASAGGGGLDHNSGGGGGGNGGTGGFGGYQLEPCGSSPFNNRGIGGLALTYSNAANKIFLGGGGGAGHVNNPGNPSLSGGNGGGIIIITAGSIRANAHRIIANGAGGTGCTVAPGMDCHEGMGGGGGGGTVLLDIVQVLDPTVVDNTGGKGADMSGSTPLGGRIGPGGGGGGGLLWISSVALPANLVNNNNGGAGGVLVDDGNNPFGTTAGLSGIALFDLDIPVATAPFEKNIDSVRIGSVGSCKQISFTGMGYVKTNPIAAWQWTLGDGNTSNAQNLTHTYQNAGTYQVKLVVTDINGCRDSISTSVTTFANNFDFDYSQDACNPLIIQFTGTGDNLLNPYWSLGDATIISGNVAPIHTYAGYGTYTVKFHVDGGCPDTISKIITLNLLKENIVITPDTTICDGSTKQLRSLTALSYCWSPATFLDNPNAQNPVTSTTQNITYYLTSTIPGNNLIANGNFSAGNTAFTSSYNFASTNVTEGQYFVGTNPQAWNGSLSACSDHTGNNGNMMLVNGSPTPDVEVWTQTINVIPNTNYSFSTWIQALWPPNPAQLQFSINGNTIGNLITASLPTCTWTQFYATWNSGNQTTAVISIVNKNTQIQGNDFALDDIHFSPVVVKQDSVRITVEKPVVKTNNDTSVCSGNTVQLNTTGAAGYSWSPLAGLSDPNIANPVATLSATSQYIVTGTTANGCIGKDTVLLSTHPLPVITKTGDTSICRNSPAPLFVTGGVSWLWSPAASLNDATISNPLASPTANTTYIINITDTYNCSYQDSIKVSLLPVPVFSATGDTSVCLGSGVTLQATGGDTYAWSPAIFLDDPSLPNPTATPDVTTQFSVYVSENVCNYDSTIDVLVTVNPSPVVRAEKSNDIDCSVPTAQLTASGASSYAWTPATGLDFADRHNPVAGIDTTTTFMVTGSNQFGCTSAASVTVKVTKENIAINAVPNAFSPNHDGYNDCFGIRKWGAVTLIEFSVFNRWGQKIFTTKNPSQCWDGTFNGKQQDTGGYAYVIRARTLCGEVKRTGTVMLIR